MSADLNSATVESITLAQFKAVSVALRKIDALHDCNPVNWSTRVSTPGFAPTYVGVGYSTWTCDVCLPMVVEAMTRACGGRAPTVTPTQEKNDG